MASSISDDEPPDGTGAVASLTGNGHGLLDVQHPQNSSPPSVFQGSGDLTVHKDVQDYVPTPALEEADDRLKDHGWVVLCGPPGSGKTTLAHALSRISKKRDQYAVYVLEKVLLWKLHVGERERSIVVLDGNFGRCCLNNEQYEDWQMNFNTILQMIRIGGVRLVITVYPHILHKLQQLDSHLDSFLTDGSGIVWLTSDLPQNVKENMLNFHLMKLGIETEQQSQIVGTVLHNDKTIKCGPVFPWCCGQMVKQWSSLENPSSVFLIPAEAYATLFKQMVLDDHHGTFFVAVLVLTMEGVSNFLHNLYEGGSNLQKLGMPQVDDDTLTRYADILHGKQSILFEGTFSSRVLYEAAGLALGRYFRLPTLLRVCDVPFLVKYVHFTLKDQAVPCVTVGGIPGCSRDHKTCTADQQALVERICTEIIEGNLQYICQHPSLQCPEFLEDLNKYCAMDKKKMERFSNTKDTVHQLTLLYWSAFLPSPTLTRWCLDKMETIRQLSVVSLMACSLFDHITQTCQCRLQSLLSESLTVNYINYSRCTMDFPLPKQCLTKAVQQTFRTAECVESRLCYLFDPSLPIPTDLLAVQVSHDRLQLQIKDKRLWYLVFRLLADRGPNETDKNGDSLLHVAANSGETAIVRLCLDAGAVISQKNRKGETPYQLTQPTREQEAQKRTLSDTYTISRRFLQADKREAQFHLLYEIDVDQKINDGRTLLMLMCCQGERVVDDITNLLIQTGADVNARTEHGDTPLLLAAKNGCSDIVEQLLQHGAHVNAKNKDGVTPLLWAARNGHSGIVQQLLLHGAQDKTLTKVGTTPLLWAARKGHSGIVRQLSEHSAHVNEQNE